MNRRYNNSMRRFYYLASLLFVFVIPAATEGYFVWGHINKLNLLVFAVGICVLGSIWDIWATRHGRRDRVWLWTFNRSETLGVTFFDLPIEEYVFYLASSIYIILNWESLRLFSETGNVLLYLFTPLIATLWSLLFIAVPVLMGRVRRRQTKTAR